MKRDSKKAFFEGTVHVIPEAIKAVAKDMTAESLAEKLQSNAGFFSLVSQIIVAPALKKITEKSEQKYLQTVFAVFSAVGDEAFKNSSNKTEIFKLTRGLYKRLETLDLEKIEDYGKYPLLDSVVLQTKQVLLTIADVAGLGFAHK